MIVHYCDRTLCYDTSQCYVGSPQWYVKINPRTMKKTNHIKRSTAFSESGAL